MRRPVGAEERANYVLVARRLRESASVATRAVGAMDRGSACDDDRCSCRRPRPRGNGSRPIQGLVETPHSVRWAGEVGATHRGGCRDATGAVGAMSRLRNACTMGFTRAGSPSKSEKISLGGEAPGLCLGAGSSVPTCDLLGSPRASAAIPDRVLGGRARHEAGARSDQARPQRRAARRTRDGDATHAPGPRRRSLRHPVGKLLCEFRLRDDLAELSGIPQSEISRFERGQGNPTLETIGRLLSSLGRQVASARAA